MKDSNNKEGLIVNKLIVSIDRFVERFLTVAKELYPNESDYTEDSSYYTFKHLSSTLNAYNHAIKNYLVGVEEDYYNENLYFTFDLDSLISSVDLYSNKLNSNRLVYIFNIFSNKINRILFDVVIKDENGFYILNYRYTDHPLYANFRSYAIDILENIKTSSQFIDNESSESWKIDLMNDELLYLNNRLIEETIKSFNLLERSKQDLNSVKKEIDNKSGIIFSELKENIKKFFSSQSLSFNHKVTQTLSGYNDEMANIQKNYKKDIVVKLGELKRNLNNNKSELDALLGDVKLYQDKMTNKAVNEMSAHYYDKSKFERNSYFILTIISAIIIIFSVNSAYKGVNNYYDQYVSTELCESSEKNKSIKPPLILQSYEQCMKDLTVKREATQKYAFNYLIFRLSFSLLLFLAVIYASRIAMRAYNHWRQSENMYLKLNTLSPFIGSLEKPVRNDVHLSLVPDYFGKDAGIVENSKDAAKDIPNNISNVAIKIIEQAGNTITSKFGNDKESKSSTDSESNTEKNGKKPEGRTE